MNNLVYSTFVPFVHTTNTKYSFRWCRSLFFYLYNFIILSRTIISLVPFGHQNRTIFTAFFTKIAKASDEKFRCSQMAFLCSQHLSTSCTSSPLWLFFSIRHVHNVTAKHAFLIHWTCLLWQPPGQHLWPGDGPTPQHAHDISRGIGAWWETLLNEYWFHEIVEPEANKSY